MENRWSLSPCGESGLKYHQVDVPVSLLLSLPMRGEWIEITECGVMCYLAGSLSPCGESGLKFVVRHLPGLLHLSLPMRGEWIEIDR